MSSPTPEPRVLLPECHPYCFLQPLDSWQFGGISLISQPSSPGQASSVRPAPRVCGSLKGSPEARPAGLIDKLCGAEQDSGSRARDLWEDMGPRRHEPWRRLEGNSWREFISRTEWWKGLVYVEALEETNLKTVRCPPLVAM